MHLGGLLLASSALFVDAAARAPGVKAAFDQRNVIPHVLKYHNTTHAKHNITHAKHNITHAKHISTVYDPTTGSYTAPHRLQENRPSKSSTSTAPSSSSAKTPEIVATPAVPVPSAAPPEVGMLLLIAAAVLIGGGFYMRNSLTSMASEGAGSHSLQLASFLALVALQTTAILLFKVCQSHGAYTFSPASSIAITEALKFTIAATLHTRHARSTGEEWLAGLSPRMVLNYAGLSALYTLNNYITFEVHTIADPGSYTLGKSVTPYVVAVMLRFTGDQLHALQWVCIVLQCGCLVVAQYDPCHGVGAIPMRAYMLIGFSTCITATCGVWNQKVIKGFDTPVNLQNLAMYSCGVCIALSMYLYGLVSGTDASTIGFFEGYTFLGLCLIVSQALQGIAVSWVLKYADAIVKNFAGSAVMALLVVVSTYWFNLHTTLLTWVGVMMVLVITWCYMAIALKLPKV